MRLWFHLLARAQVSHSSPPQLADDAVVESGHGSWHLMTCASAQRQLATSSCSYLSVSLGRSWGSTKKELPADGARTLHP
jgi:hypothetical protein